MLQRAGGFAGVARLITNKRGLCFRESFHLLSFYTHLLDSYQFAPGTLVVFDRGYADYDWRLELTLSKVDFVTRLKDNAAYGIVERRPVRPGSDILRDEVILLTSQQEIGPEARLRRIEVWLEDKQETMVFVTNNLKLGL